MTNRSLSPGEALLHGIPYHGGFGLRPDVGETPLAASLSLHLRRFLCLHHPFLEAP
jgi:hypothetical protein